MNDISKPQAKYRKDYQVPSHLINTVDLYIDLGEDVTIVTALFSVCVNKEFLGSAKQLILDGKEQKLKSVKINNTLLRSDQYELTNEKLILNDVPEEFKLEIKSEIKPQENTLLSGLYKSNDMFCTQCEAEGFRRIIYFLDRPDVLARYTTTIVADKHRYPVLLSNGNLVDSGELTDGLHWMKWEDPFKKPCYLFAMVAGDLDYIEDYFTTCSGRKVTLRIFCEKGHCEQCKFAMESLKKAMRWDEEKYGREYDLDVFMIVAVNDFNFGAMENKGLNIFNAKYIFADPKTATDVDYENIDAVVAHEYFHNWTGNRITCRDWFQLSLKEGLTVFRDHSFSADIFSRAVTRIDEVRYLRTTQFSEDAGPLAHAVRPDSYIEMNNFYTTTVYEKGAEVIRMMRTLLGAEKFRAGMDLYFARHDGQAVTCDDFVNAMAEASNIDLTQFKLWYSQAGTPELYITSRYDVDKKEYSLQVRQSCPATPGQSKKLPMHIPLAVGLLDGNGGEFSLQLVGKTNDKEDEKITSRILNITEENQTFVFYNVEEAPIPSLLRDFSAPVKLYYDYSEDELAFLMVNDTDEFARWEAGQRYAVYIILKLIKNWQQGEKLALTHTYLTAFKRNLLQNNVDKKLIAQMLILPSEIYIAELMDIIDVDAIYEVRQFIKQQLAEMLKDEFIKTYKDNMINKPYKFQAEEVARRSIKNVCLDYLIMLDDDRGYERCMLQVENADNMTDEFAALSTLAKIDCPERKGALQTFYNKWKEEPLVINKWFAVQAISPLEETLEEVKKLLAHPDFNIKNPNRVYALLSTFSLNNHRCFHAISGEGYRLLADQILILDKINAQIAARLAGAFSKWKRFDNARQQLMQEQLQRILSEPQLSKGVYEIVSKSL